MSKLTQEQKMQVIGLRDEMLYHKRVADECADKLGKILQNLGIGGLELTVLEKDNGGTKREEGDGRSSDT